MKTSISHLTGKEQKALGDIKNNIIEQLSPLLIFCFDSNLVHSISRNSFLPKEIVEGWAFSCNLLIIVSDEAVIGDGTKKEIQKTVAPFGRVNLFVHPLGFMLQKLKDNNLFFTWVQLNATLLFDKDNSWQSLPTAIKKQQEYSAQAERYVSQNPDFENYLDIKLISIDQELRESQNQPAPQKISVDLSGSLYESPGHMFAESLSPEQKANPYLVINYFFRDYSLQDAKKHINGWMTGMYEKVGWIKKRPVDLIYFIERCFQLIEAGWFVNREDNSKRVANLALHYKPDEIDFMDSGLYCAPQFKASCWDYFPRFLNKKEFVNPYRVFSKFFKFQSLNEWKSELQNAFYLTLSNLDVHQTGEAINALGFTKRLNKFVEACHLINVRELEWTNGKLILKTYNGLPNE